MEGEHSVGTHAQETRGPRRTIAAEERGRAGAGVFSRVEGKCADSEKMEASCADEVEGVGGKGHPRVDYDVDDDDDGEIGSGDSD
eukprot:1852754-Rhodomonas_salina.2